MSILLSQKNAIAIAPVRKRPQPQSQQQKECLVVHWLRDDNNRLYCQWVKEKH